VSIQGKVKQIGGIPEKIYGARQAGMHILVIPEENRNDVPGDVRGIEIVQARTVEDVLPHVFAAVPKAATTPRAARMRKAAAAARSGGGKTQRSPRRRR
jgi:predicted ATP-dependent protease